MFASPKGSSKFNLGDHLLDLGTQAENASEPEGLSEIFLRAQPCFVTVSTLVTLATFATHRYLPYSRYLRYSRSSLRKGCMYLGCVYQL